MSAKTRTSCSCWFSCLNLYFILVFLPLITLSYEHQQLTNCNLFEGSWIFDDSYPLYDSLQCPFIDPGLNCLKNGRNDQDFLKYRWQPTDCDLPRFNGEDLLQKFRGKSFMFVGDSLSNNQWQSLACMLHAAVPNSNYTFDRTRNRSVLSFPEFEFTVTFLKNGFLIDLVVEEAGRVLKLDSLSRSDQWKGVDFLIFNSYHWWIHTGSLQTWDYFQVGDKIYKEMDHMEAYKIALTTWANWIDSNIDPAMTKVFFQGISAVHYHGKDWNEPMVQDCRGQTKPIEGSNYPGDRYPGEAVVKNVLSNMTKSVYLLDITLLTQLRKDGHPSRYANGEIDCSHWCVAGVPDTWNELLYTILLQK
ncbi:protein trichome birefringence-like 42 [Nicotiana sylvestris]|uniref:Protein trichome birefringence-like 42 n=2 Tax=Nicotiana TaxID=4085 RepID=A0A1S4DCZ4_TOBAC|nr:PREDICTED: protein trichome birefringence-like 42 [Nicotiana sylvestris]XP_016511213.1 PREDICTED: protein trichome birefringence-like 42 [Nicotiana tabacum]